MAFESIAYISSGRCVSRGEWCHPDRVIDSYEVIYVLSGEVYLCEDGIEYVLRPGEILHMFPQVRHYGYRPSEKVSFYWCHYYGSFPGMHEIKYFKPTETYSIELLFKQLLNYANYSGYPKEGLDCIMKMLLIELQICSRTASPGSPLVTKVADWIHANRDRMLSVHELSDTFGYHPDYLNTLFKKQYGRGLKEYINDENMRYIKSLLISTDHSLKEIAQNSGFHEYDNFLKYFIYHEHCTPTEFRNLYYRTHVTHK